MGDLHPHINDVANVKRQVFHEKIEGHKRILAELDFDGNSTSMKSV